MNSEGVTNNFISKYVNFHRDQLTTLLTISNINYQIIGRTLKSISAIKIVYYIK